MVFCGSSMQGGLLDECEHWQDNDTLCVVRVDEGSQSTGLTVSEAVQLLRSSLPAQQVAALKTITTVLMQARPAGIAAPDAATIVPMPPACMMLPSPCMVTLLSTFPSIHPLFQAVSAPWRRPKVFLRTISWP